MSAGILGFRSRDESRERGNDDITKSSVSSEDGDCHDVSLNTYLLSFPMLIHSAKCPLKSLPIEILRSIFEILNTVPGHIYDRLDILNVIKTCKCLYSVGLPYLYHDVIVRGYWKSQSFFDALPRNGWFVERLRIDEVCTNSRDYDTEYVHYFSHNHNLNTERMVAIARYCTHLRVLFVGWSHFREWQTSALKLFTEQRMTLQTVILPTLDKTDLSSAALRFYITLSGLRQLRLSLQYMGDSLLPLIARSCTELKDLYLYRCPILKTESFLAFLKLIPNLQTLHLHGDSNEDSIDNVSISSFIPDLLSTLPFQNGKLRTLILNNVFIPRLPNISPESFPSLRVLDISTRPERSSEKIENLIPFLQALKTLQFLHIDDRDMFLADSSDVLLKFIPRTVKVFVSHCTYNPKSILHDLIRDKILFSRGLFHNTEQPSPLDGLDRDIFMDDWEYKFR